jgi:hypothetical protein
MGADISNQQANLKENYNMDKKALQHAAKLKVLAHTLHEHAKTFKDKVAYVKKHMPEVTNPEAFVAAALREAGDLKPHGKEG